jgi:hypothetical protein
MGRYSDSMAPCDSRGVSFTWYSCVLGHMVCCDSSSPTFDAVEINQYGKDSGLNAHLRTRSYRARHTQPCSCRRKSAFWIICLFRILVMLRCSIAPAESLGQVIFFVTCQVAVKSHLLKPQPKNTQGMLLSLRMLIF